MGVIDFVRGGRGRGEEPVELVLYTRPGCHLCDEMKAEIARASLPRHELREVNIDTDPALVERFGQSIPVLAIRGHVAFKARLTRVELERKFARLAASGS